ncbi:MAG: hypothetical protein AABY75_05510 [Bacteroidota bacterium]
MEELKDRGDLVLTMEEVEAGAEVPLGAYVVGGGEKVCCGLGHGKDGKGRPKAETREELLARLKAKMMAAKERPTRGAEMLKQGKVEGVYEYITGEGCTTSDNGGMGGSLVKLDPEQRRADQERLLGRILEKGPAAVEYLAQLVEMGRATPERWGKVGMRAAEALLRVGLPGGWDKAKEEAGAVRRVVEEFRRTAEAMRDAMALKLEAAKAGLLVDGGIVKDVTPRKEGGE